MLLYETEAKGTFFGLRSFSDSPVGEHQIRVANKNKYLGAILDNKGSFKNHVEMLVEKAGNSFIPC